MGKGAEAMRERGWKAGQTSPAIERRKPGRPRGRRKEWAITPARQFGRVSDADWQMIRQACERAGMGLVEWALPTLLAKAKREARAINA